MALGYNVTLRNARLDEIAAAAGNGAKLRIYSGTRPATGGTETTLLAELTCGSPFAGAASGGVLTANAVSSNTASASGTASWFRLRTSGGAHVMDGNVGVSGSDLNISSTAIVSGGTVEVTSFVLTHGNA